MKILAVSLLRVGDLIMHENVLLSLREKFPEAEIHLLVNDVSQRYAKIIKNIKGVHVFRRLRWQAQVIEENRPLLGAYRELRQLIKELQALNFDLVVNLTHNHASARVMDLLSVPEKTGMAYLDGKRNPLHTLWQHYMNENFSRNPRAAFHYVDTLTHSLELPHKPHRHRIPSSLHATICLQPLTSEARKNWPTENFFELAERLQKNFPHKKIVVLAAPDEETRLRPYFPESAGIEIKAVPWAQLQDILAETCLLVTGDTSVQHLAAQSGVPCVSLFLGDARPEKTAPYTDSVAYILCPQDAQISIQDVYASAHAHLQGENLGQLKLTSSLYQVRKRPSGFQFLEKLGEGVAMNNVKRALEQTVWQIYLDKGHLDLVGPFGSSSYNFLEEFSHQLKMSEVRFWLRSRFSQTLAHFVFLERLENDFRKKTLAAFSPGSTEDLHSLADSIQAHLCQWPEGHDYYFNLSQELEQETISFACVQKIRAALHEVKYLVETESKFLKTLIREMKEREVTHVSGSGTLSDISFAAT